MRYLENKGKLGGKLVLLLSGGSEKELPKQFNPAA
jgi:hypothetical protein